MGIRTIALESNSPADNATLPERGFASPQISRQDYAQFNQAYPRPDTSSGYVPKLDLVDGASNISAINAGENVGIGATGQHKHGRTHGVENVNAGPTDQVKPATDSSGNVYAGITNQPKNSDNIYAGTTKQTKSDHAHGADNVNAAMVEQGIPVHATSNDNVSTGMTGLSKSGTSGSDNVYAGMTNQAKQGANGSDNQYAGLTDQSKSWTTSLKERLLHLI